MIRKKSPVKAVFWGAVVIPLKLPRYFAPHDSFVLPGPKPIQQITNDRIFLAQNDALKSRVI